MLNKLKSFLKEDKNTSGASVGSPIRKGGPRIWTMSKAMREAFEMGGCKYNIKVVLRGMRGTGKSALLARLHEHEFNFSQYSPTPEIAAATIKYTGDSTTNERGNAPNHASPQLKSPGLQSPAGQPAARESEDANIKVDVWDIVDEGFAEGASPSSSKGKPSTPFGISSGRTEGDKLQMEMFADARSIDVYRGCHGAILLADCRKPETLQYIVDEVKRIPPTCAICIALNFTDVPKDQHKITEREIHDIAKSLQRAVSPMVHLASQGKAPERSLSIAPSWCSLSCLTGAGMDVLRSFFTVAVALVKLETLETQMKQIYSQVEVHQALMLQQRAVMMFEEKERAKRAAEEEDRRLHPEKYVQENLDDRERPSSLAPTQAISATVSAAVQQQQPHVKPQPSPPPTQQRQPQKAPAPPPEQPAKWQPPPSKFSAKQTPQPKRSAPRTAEEEQRLADDFYGDVSSEDESEIKAKGVKGYYDESESEDDQRKASSPNKSQSSKAAIATTTNSNNNSVRKSDSKSSSLVGTSPNAQNQPASSAPVFTTKGSSSLLKPTTTTGKKTEDIDVTTDEEENDKNLTHQSTTAKNFQPAVESEKEDVVAVPVVAAPQEPTFDIGDAGGGVKDDFFGGDDDEDEEAEDIADPKKDEVEAISENPTTQPSLPPVTVAPPSKPVPEVPQPRQLGTRRRADSQADFYTSTGDVTEHVGNASFTSANASFARRSLPVNVDVPSASSAAAPPVVEVDVAALLAQMQAAIAGTEETVVDENRKEKKPKKDKSDKKEKKDKTDKKEKSDKKDKKKSKKTRNSDDEDEDGGDYSRGGGRQFDNYDDDGGFEELS